MEILTLLKNQNKCLEKFLSITHDFLQNKKLEEIELLEKNRLAVVKTFQHYDHQITLQIQALQNKKITKDLVLTNLIRAEVEQKNEHLKNIILLDQKLTRFLEETQNQLLNDIQFSRQINERLGRFKSHWITDSGEEIDQKA